MICFHVANGSLDHFPDSPITERKASLHIYIRQFVTINNLGFVCMVDENKMKYFKYLTMDYTSLTKISLT